MRNVALHVADGVVLAVRSLSMGSSSVAWAGQPPVFDDPRVVHAFAFARRISPWMRRP